MPDPDDKRSGGALKGAERRAWYAKVYLQSTHWRTTRLEAIERANHRCQRCRRTPDVFHVHHKTYARLWAELPSDLEVLCEDCHRPIHVGKMLGVSPKARRSRRAQFRAAQLRRDRKSVLLVIDRHPRTTEDVAVLAGITPQRAGRALRDLRRQGKVKFLDGRGVWWETPQ